MPPKTMTKQIIFVDSAVQNYQSLLQKADTNAEIVILDPQKSGIQQISEILATKTGLDAIHILSHGSQGNLNLGADSLNSQNISSTESWGKALTENGDIVLYGCDVAGGETGLNFVQKLSEITKADIAASDNKTGNANKGGDWDLEIAIGSIEAPVPLNESAIKDYDYVLANFNVTQATDDGTGLTANTLSWAIRQANITAGSDTITLQTNVRVTGVMKTLINSDIDFIGNNFSVSGDVNNNGTNDAGDVRPFFVKSGTVNFSNMTITNGRAQGGNGSGAGAGMGGGLFIYNGTVSIM